MADRQFVVVEQDQVDEGHLELVVQVVFDHVDHFLEVVGIEQIEYFGLLFVVCGRF